MNYVSYLKIQKPGNPIKVAMIGFNQYIATDDEAIKIIIDSLCELDEPHVAKVREDFGKTQLSGKKQDAINLWHSLNFLADETMDPIENMADFIGQIQAKTLSEFIHQLPKTTINNLIFTVSDQLGTL